MSAYVVEDKTINRILSFMLRKQWADSPWKIGKEELIAAIVKLGEEMRQGNVDSVNARYRNQTDMIPKNPFVFEEVEVTTEQAAMSLACWLYQSCEGGCDETDLFKRIERFREALDLTIDQESPAYKAAEWG